MRYFGGKFRTSTQIANYINPLIGDKKYIEPFIGGSWVFSKIKANEKLGSDLNKYLSSLYNAILAGWEIPDTITKELYTKIKNNKDKYPEELVAFVGFGCSFSGKWFGGYAKSADRNYALNAKNSLIKKSKGFENSTFQYKDYRDYNVKDCIIYCDPPYDETTKFDAIGNFNTAEFWQTMRKWSKDNIVFISEYIAPDDFENLLEMPTKMDMHTKNGKEMRVEKLFKLRT